MLYESEERRILGEDEWLKSIGHHRGVAIRILELFDDMLEEKNITIPDADRCGDACEARLYGCTYGILEDQIEALLKEYFPTSNLHVCRIDIEKFLQKFNENYQFLYDNHDSVAGYCEALEAGNEFMYTHPDFIAKFIQYRGDSITSDREVAAFAFTLVDMTE